MRPAATKDLRDAASIFNITADNLLVVKKPQPDATFRNVEPLSLTNVAGDGNCLFNCFSLILTGSENFASTIRQQICDCILTHGYEPHHLILSNGSFASNGRDYIVRSRMCENAVFAGPLEISAFTQLTFLDVVVYSNGLKEWIWFSSSYNANRPQVFLYHHHLHYQVVSLLSCKNLPQTTSSFEPQSSVQPYLPPDNILLDCHEVYKSKSHVPLTLKPESKVQSSNCEHDKLQQKLKHHLKSFPGEHVLLDSISFIGKTCDKCLRTSTLKYNIDVQTFNPSSLPIKKKSFGQKLDLNTYVNLCKNCHTYTTTDRTVFKHALPSILASYWVSDIKNEAIVAKIFKFLPLSVIELFCCTVDKYNGTFQRLLQTCSLSVADRTLDRTLLFQTKKDLQGQTLQRNYNKFPLPDVVCPWGCWEFVESCQTISLEHFIAKVDADFRDNFHKESQLMGINASFPEGFILLEKFHIRPAVIVDVDKNILFLTCCKHSGETKQYLHPPRNPVLNSVSSNKPERLAITQQQLHIVKTGKPKFNSHSSHLIEEKGSYSGISSSTLQFPTFLQTSTTLDDLSELVITKGRSDVYPLINYFVDNNIVDNNFADYLFNSNLNLNAEEILAAVKNATNVSLYDAFKMQVQLNRSQEKDLLDLPLPLYSHNLHCSSEHGCEPMRIFSSANPHITVLEGLLRFTSSIISSFRDSGNNELSELSLHFAKLLSGSSVSSWKKTKENIRRITTILGTQFNEESMSVTWMIKLLKAAKIPYVNVSSRSFSQISFDEDTVKNNQIFVFPSSRIQRDTDIPPDTLMNDSNEYQLIFLSKNVSKGAFYCRHLRTNSAWFESFSCEKSFAEVSFANFYDFAIKGSWDFAVYEKIETSDNRSLLQTFLTSIGGQKDIFCEIHHCLLIQKNPRDLLSCFDPTCINKAKWVCPQPFCTTGICKKHSDKIATNSRFSHISSEKSRKSLPFETPLPHTNSALETQSIEPVDHQTKEMDLIFEPDEFLTFSIDTSDEKLPLSSNAGVPVVNYQLEASHSDRVPTKVLLNNYLNVLQRTKVPLWTTNAHKNFLQSIVARIPNTSVPLLYPEALLFPSIFWKQETDGSFAGALPSCLMQSDELNKKLGFATVTNHLWARLTNGALLTSSSLGYASLAFDIKMNQELNKSHSNYIVFKKGFEDYLHDDEALRMPSCAIKWDGLDSSKRVQEVAAACAEESPSYFFTLTCSMAKQFGIQPLFDAINETYADESKDVFEAVIQSFMSLFVRMWERVSSVVMIYIEHSNERPFGDVFRIWWRYEFQTTQGNLPHIHCLVWVNDCKTSRPFQDRVVLMKSQLLYSLESDFLQTIGLVADKDAAFALYKDAARMHFHSCPASNYRCHKKTNENGQSYCRYPVYPSSMEYYMAEVDVNHSDQAFDVLKLCQLAEEKKGFYNTMSVTEELKAGQWFYPSKKNQNVTPMNPHIFALTQSQNNILICDKYLSARYIAKYAAGVEEKAKVLISAGKRENEIQVEVGEIQNTKIAGVQHRIQREEQNNRKDCCQARHICITECYWHLFNLPFVKSSFSSVCVNTNEMECRPGIKLSSHSNCSFRKTKSEKTSIWINLRDNLPIWRQFTKTQKSTIKLHLESSISVCNITAHSARPPELLFIQNPKDYFWLLERKQNSKQDSLKLIKMLQTRKMVWVDGFGKQVLVRKNRVSQFLQCLQTSTNETAVHLRTILETEADLEPFTSPNDDTRSNAVVYFSKIYPSDGGKFLVHLLLSMGSFETELDLFSCNSLWDCFKKAGLWTKSTTKENILNITRKYIIEQAQYLPGSTRMFDKNVVQCFEVLTEYFEKATILYMQPPRVMLSSIQSSANEKTRDFLDQIRLNIAKGLVASGKVENCPSEQLISQATTSCNVSFRATISKLPSQTVSSYERQTLVLKSFKNAVDLYSSGVTSFIPHHFVLGKPGTGKSTVTLVVLCYSMCKGLNCMVTTLAGEKASQFGGMHLHRLIPLPVKTSLPVMKQVESTVQKLYFDPMRLAFLKNLDVLFIEEIGMLNSEQWCVLDHTLRFINNSNQPMGGVLVIGNGDPKQLRPPSGPLLWISPVLLTNFKLFYLSEYIRMVDPLGTRILALLDNVHITEEETAEIVNTLQHNCRFVETWNEINDEAILRVVPTKQAERKLIDQHYQIIQNLQRDHQSFKSVDEISRRGQNLWTATKDDKSVKHLNKNCLEPDCLLIYEGAPMRVTRNILELQITQGQLCVVKNVPASNSVSIDMYVAPPCVRTLPPLQPDGSRNFSAFGWRIVSVKRREGLPHNFRHNSSLRRNQFPLKPFQAATIHKCIGDDVPLLATQIASNDPSERSMFKLWERNQLLVLISRVKELKHLTFVGSKSSSLRTIAAICSNNNQWDFFIHDFVESLSRQNSSLALTTFPIHQHVYAMSRQSIPEDNCATVYCLMSLKDQSLSIGRCSSIRKTLQQVNSYCSEVSLSLHTKKPWALLCAAFEPSISVPDSSTKVLESKWLNAVPTSENSNVEEIIQLLKNITESTIACHQSINFVAFLRM